MTELVKSSPDISSLAALVPDEMKDAIQNLVRIIQPPKEGFGDVDMERMSYAPPVIRVKQPVSMKAPDSARNGDLYSADTGEVLKQPFRFVPIFPYENRVRFGEGGAKIDCSSEDRIHSRHGTRCETCPDLPWRDGKLQKCQDVLNIFVVTEDFRQLYHLQFSKTSLSAGQSILKQARNAGDMPWHRIYALSTTENRNPNSVGLYWVLKATFTNERTNPAFHPIGATIHDMLLARRVEQKTKILQQIEEGRATIEAAVDGKTTDLPQADLSDM